MTPEQVKFASQIMEAIDALDDAHARACQTYEAKRAGLVETLRQCGVKVNVGGKL
jgi:hypothetical protein